MHIAAIITIDKADVKVPSLVEKKTKAMAARFVCIICVLISVLQVVSCTITLQVLRSGRVVRLRCLNGQIPIESNPEFTINFRADGRTDPFPPNFGLDEYRIVVTPETEIIAYCSHEGDISERVAIAARQEENTTLIDPFDVTINQTAMLNCPLTLGILSNTGILEPYEIKWFNSTNGLVDSDGSNLELPITIQSDSLRYRCELRVRLCNGSGDPILSGCEVVTRRGPTFVLRVLGFDMLETPESVNVTSNDSASFSCGARGRGDIEIDWIYDGKSINVTRFDDSNMVQTVNSPITISSSDITKNEHVVRCNVTQRINGRTFRSSRTATLTCFDCVTATPELPETTTTFDTATSTDETSSPTLTPSPVPISTIVVAVVASLFGFVFIGVLLIVCACCWKYKNEVGNSRIARSIKRSISRDPKLSSLRGQPGTYTSTHESPDTGRNGGPLYAEVDPRLFQAGGIQRQEGVVETNVNDLYSAAENGHGSGPVPNDPTTLDLIYNVSQGESAYSGYSGQSGASQSGPGPHKMPEFNNFDHELSQPISETNGTSHLCPVDPSQHHRKTSDVSVHSGRSGRSDRSHLSHLSHLSHHSDRSHHSHHSDRSHHSGNSCPSCHSGRSSRSGRSGHSHQSARERQCSCSRACSHCGGSQPHINELHQPPYLQKAYHGSHDFRQYPNPGDNYPPSETEHNYPQLRANYDQQQFSSHPHLAFQQHPSGFEGRRSPANTHSSPKLSKPAQLHHERLIQEQALLNVMSCLMHNKNCQIPNCPCSQLQDGYRHLLSRLYPLDSPDQRNTRKVVSDNDSDAQVTDSTATDSSDDPATDSIKKRELMHLPIAAMKTQPSIDPNLHPHFHITSKSHIRRSSVYMSTHHENQRSRSKSLSDLTPVVEVPETPAMTPGMHGGSLIAGTPVQGPGTLGEDGSFQDTCGGMQPCLLREISLSADNLPALCLNGCPITPSPVKGAQRLLGAALPKNRKNSFNSKSVKPSLNPVQEQSDSQDTDDSNTSSRSGTPELPMKSTHSTHSDVDDGIVADAQPEDSILSQKFPKDFKKTTSILSRGSSSGYDTDHTAVYNSINSSKLKANSMPRSAGRLPPLSSSFDSNKLSGKTDCLSDKWESTSQHSASTSPSHMRRDMSRSQPNRLNRSPSPYETDSKSENGVTTYTTEV